MNSSDSPVLAGVQPAIPGEQCTKSSQYSSAFVTEIQNSQDEIPAKVTAAASECHMIF